MSSMYLFQGFVGDPGPPGEKGEKGAKVSKFVLSYKKGMSWGLDQGKKYC